MRLGERQKLIVVKKVEFGVYLAERQDAGEKDRVLLPIKQVPAGTKEGDKLEVTGSSDCNHASAEINAWRNRIFKSGSGFKNRSLS